MAQVAALRPRDAGETAALLNVTHSLTGRFWQARLKDERLAYRLSQAHGLPEILARVLAGRGVTVDDAERFLSPVLRDNLCDPSCLTDMERAAARLATAVTRGESICIFGDYDVDGATSSALLKRYLKSLGADGRIYIPDRLAEGYGPNGPAIERLAAEGVTLVITVDCGTHAFAPLERAKALGLDVIVADHHQAAAELPAAHALINPNRLDCPSGQGVLAAVGVCFLLAVATNRHLRRSEFFTPSRPEPNLMALLDLVALGTVADVVPLVGVNRSFVAQGLKILARTENAGLRALAQVAKLDRPPSAYHLGFVYGPRVNAGGRVGEADLGARLLTTDDPVEALTIATKLDRYNRERQAVEAQVLDQAQVRAEAQGISPFAPVVVAGEGWHPGVVGIVASRLREIYGRPAIVIGLDKGVGKGSGRSMAGVDLGRAVRAAVDQGYLVTGGGHAMAAGLSLRAEQLDAFTGFLAAHLAPEIERAARAPKLLIDGAVSPAVLRDRALLELIGQAAPFGPGNPEPVFALTDMRVTFADVVGSGHVSATLEAEGTRLRAIAFRAAAAPLGEALLRARGGLLHVAGRLKPGWRGGCELEIEDAARPAT